MGTYTVIATVGEQLVSRISEGLMNDLITDRNGVMLCSPTERGDATIGIYLYQIEENTDISYHGMRDINIRQQQFPPMVLKLYYMITAYANSDLKFRAIQEQRLLGRVLQILYDQPTLDSATIGNDVSGEPARLTLLPLTVEEKMKIWSHDTRHYKPSLCYCVTPVELSSTRTKQIQRVTEFTVTLQQKES